VIAVEKEFLLHEAFTVGVVEQWNEKDYIERLGLEDEGIAGFVALSNSELEVPEMTENVQEKKEESEKGDGSGGDKEEEKENKTVDKKKVVGFIFLDTTSDQIVWFRKLLVLPAYRRHGIGYSLAVMGVQSLEKRKVVSLVGVRVCFF
tara:strand:- start:580 stop:1023 length:444 start_codon:yes stop_codon:yes gene_type:complete